MTTKYLLQIDILKGIAIISVLLMHALPTKLLTDMFHILYIGQAVPIFIVIFGFNQALSLNPRSISYTTYYYKKVSRFLMPFVFAFAISVLAGVLFFLLTGETILRINRYLIFGRLPLPGPGNYFISLLFQYTLTIPILYKLCAKRPVLTFLTSCVLSVIFEFIRGQLPPYLRDYGLIFFRFLPAVFLGMFIYRNWNKKNYNYIFIYLGAVLAFFYQFYSLYITGSPITSIYENWGIGYFLSFFYPSLLFLIGLKLLPSVSNNVVYEQLALIGKASLHIFLVQIIYFSFVRASGNLFIVSIIFCIIVGRIFYFLDKVYTPLIIKVGVNHAQ